MKSDDLIKCSRRFVKTILIPLETSIGYSKWHDELYRRSLEFLLLMLHTHVYPESNFEVKKRITGPLESYLCKAFETSDIRNNNTRWCGICMAKAKFLTPYIKSNRPQKGFGCELKDEGKGQTTDVCSVDISRSREETVSKLDTLDVPGLPTDDDSLQKVSKSSLKNPGKRLKESKKEPCPITDRSVLTSSLGDDTGLGQCEVYADSYEIAMTLNQFKSIDLRKGDQMDNEPWKGMKSDVGESKNGKQHPPKINEPTPSEDIEDKLLIQTLESEVASFLESIKAERSSEPEIKIHRPLGGRGSDHPIDEPSNSAESSREERMQLHNLKLKERLDQAKEKRKKKEISVEPAYPDGKNDGQQVAYMSNCGEMAVAPVGTSCYQSPWFHGNTHGQSSSSSYVNTYPNWNREWRTQRGEHPSAGNASWLDSGWGYPVSSIQEKKTRGGSGWMETSNLFFSLKKRPPVTSKELCSTHHPVPNL